MKLTTPMLIPTSPARDFFLHGRGPAAAPYPEPFVVHLFGRDQLQVVW